MSSPAAGGNPGQLDDVSGEVRVCRAWEAGLRVENCRQNFVPSRWWQIFCGKDCSDAYHNRRKAAGRQLTKRLREVERRLEALEALAKHLASGNPDTEN